MIFTRFSEVQSAIRAQKFEVAIGILNEYERVGLVKDCRIIGAKANGYKVWVEELLALCRQQIRLPMAGTVGKIELNLMNISKIVDEFNADASAVKSLFK